VLIDAPCSGEGMFRKEEAAITDWSPETVQMCAQRQQEILQAAAQLVRPGGRLVYSTCTFAPEENEQTVERFLLQHPEFEPVTPDAPWFEAGPNGSVRLWPHKLLGEGHFAAVLCRKGQQSRQNPVPAPADKLPPEWSAFQKDLQIVLPAGKPMLFGQSLYWIPEDMPQLKGLKVERPGLELGTARKGRFEPAHALALWLPGCDRSVEVSPDSDDIRRYLHGDVIPTTQKGWCLVQTGGYSIGWGKGDGTVLKNHYPKGLRR